MAEWVLQPGESILRKELHQQYGGKPQGGISPSRKSPNVFLFSGDVGQQFGYDDRWVVVDGDRRFRYIGEGQEDDQEFRHGNLQVLNHRDDGRALRLFSGASGEVTYEGEFELDQERPWMPVYGPDREGASRLMIGFLLVPVGEVAYTEDFAEDLTPGVENTDIEAINVATFESDLPGRTLTKHRREAELVTRYRQWLTSRGHETCRQRIVVEGDASPMFTDLFDETAEELVEAKGTVSRQDIRMAVGQLHDYGRHVTHRRAAVLVPSRPHADLLALLQSQGFACIYETDAGFERTENGHGDA